MATVSRKQKGGKRGPGKGKKGGRPRLKLRSTRQSGRQTPPKGEVALLKPWEDDILKLLAAKVHIGHEKAHVNMKRYIWKKRADGVHIINLEKTWHKLVLAARIIVTISDPDDVMVLSTRKFGQRAAIKFATHTGAKAVVGAWVNGSLTNPQNKSFYQPRLIIVDDPRSTFAALAETSYIGVPVIAFCGVDNNTRFVDCAIPCNNRGKYSIGLLFWLLAREVLRMRGVVPRTMEWQVSVDLFFYRDPEEIEKQQAKMAEEQNQEEDDEYVEPVDDGAVLPGAVAYQDDAYVKDDWLEAPPEVGLQGWSGDANFDQQYFGGYYDGAGQPVVPAPAAAFPADTAEQNLTPW